MTGEDKDDIVAPTDLLPHDVVLGKMASGNFSSPGNRLFKQFLMTKKREYSQISSHSAKKRFLVDCMEDWCTRMDGRFLFRETTILCTVVKSEDDKKKLLTKVNALMRNLPSPSSPQAAELEAGFAIALSQEKSSPTAKEESSPLTSPDAAGAVSSSSSDTSVSDGNESQYAESGTSTLDFQTPKRPSLSIVTKGKVTDKASLTTGKIEGTGSDAVISSSSSDSSTDGLFNVQEEQTKKTPAALSKQKQLRPSPTSITAFHQVQQDENARHEDSPS